MKQDSTRVVYDMLSSFLISNDFSKNGSVDPTLFIRRKGKELLLVQIYVDDIIFAASTPELCDLFAKIMCSKFKMSMMVDIHVEKLNWDEDKEGKAIDPSQYSGSAYRKAFKCGKKDLSMMDHDGCQDNTSKEADIILLLSVVVHQVFWMRFSTYNYGFGFNKIPMLCVKTKALLRLCCKKRSHSRSKHIEISDFTSSFEIVENGVIENFNLSIKEYQLADIFTKALGRERIEFPINKMGMRSFTLETLKKLADDTDE
ncbi:retrovirus-related pol polyprotein from transposon TNT 1-94 [Tanacetum coccineum]